jgi:hypothetical protein
MLPPLVDGKWGSGKVSKETVYPQLSCFIITNKIGIDRCQLLDSSD